MYHYNRASACVCQVQELENTGADIKSFNKWCKQIQISRQESNPNFIYPKPDDQHTGYQREDMQREDMQSCKSKTGSKPEYINQKNNTRQ